MTELQAMKALHPEKAPYPFNAEGYASANYTSPEYKINVLARILSGYDEPTWSKLSHRTKQTYNRAAVSLMGDRFRIAALLDAPVWTESIVVEVVR
jgi:hypothetical protein